MFRAVLKYGVAQWYSIGLAIGITDAQIEACTFDKPSSGSKLQAIIEFKLHECGVKETERCLLSACEGIPQPIIGSVLKCIKRESSGMSQREGVTNCYCY